MSDEQKKVSKEALKVGSALDQVLNTFVVAERNGEDPMAALGLGHLSEDEQQDKLREVHRALQRALGIIDDYGGNDD